MKYFKNINTLEELRKEYKRLVKMYHPDNGGSEEVIKEVNTEYERMFEILKNGAKTEDERNNKYDINEDEAIREMIKKVINFNVTIEIVGTWIWIGGNTYPIKDALGALGFKWCGNKKLWAWHYGEWKRVSGKRTYSQIKEKYGYTTVKKETKKSEKDKLE